MRSTIFVAEPVAEEVESARPQRQISVTAATPHLAEEHEQRGDGGHQDRGLTN
jgi:hypothetical protein